MRLKLILSLVAGLLVSYSSAEIVFTDDMDSLVPWELITDGMDTTETGDGTAIRMSSWWASGGYSQMAQNTKLTIQPNAQYNIIIGAEGHKESGDPNDPAKAFGVNVWSVQDNLWWDYFIQQDVAPVFNWPATEEPYDTYTVSFNSSDHSDFVGQKLGIDIWTKWWNNFSADWIAIEYSGDAPLVKTQPQDVVAEENETVQFIVEASSATAANYEWKKSADAEIDSGDTVVGTNSNTLTVTANAANEGWYYCVVSNSSSETDTSIPAGLWLKQEVANWKFNNDLTDSSGSWDAQLDGIDFVDSGQQGFDSNAIEGDYSVSLQGDSNAYLTVPGSEDYFNSYVQGVTVNAWVNTSDPNWAGIVAKQDRAIAEFDRRDWSGWILSASSSGYPSFSVRGTGGAASVEGDERTVYDGQWHMLTGVYDNAADEVRLYIDGELSNSVSVEDIAPDKSKQPVNIGIADSYELHNATNPYKGLIDDVSIYSYPLTAGDVALKYVELVPEAKICVEEIPMDFTDDCKVGFEDFVHFAAQWMECNLYPVEKCFE
ncbi:LamG-like jellyroll fold domain-containing protein [Sedimentisphaera salicampi]|nr:LamG-like jellyroll fold domain-containing protein [Sedimentisphaera salicampi]